MKNSLKKIFYLTVILIIIFAAYFPILKAGFTNWDDDAHVVGNTDIRQLDWEHIERMFKSRVARTYIPLTLLSFSIEYHFFKLNPFIYHLNNVLFHLLVVMLVFFLAKRFGLTLKASVWAAFIFGIHPMHVESVAWISERKDVLCAVFYLSAMLSYWKYLDEKSSKWCWLTLSVILGALSMLAKPMAFSLPLVLFLIDWWQRRKFELLMFVDKLPHFVYVLCFSWITFSVNSKFLAFNMLQAPLIFIWSLMFYLFKFFVPSHYLVIYKFPEPVSWSNLEYLYPLFILFLMLISLVRFYKNRILALALYFYLITISMIVIRSIWDFGNATVVADRFMYIPSIGFCLLIGYGIDQVNNKFRNNFLQRIIIFLILMVLLFLGLRTYQQCSVWKDNISLWSHVIKHSPFISRAYVNRAQGYLENKQFDLALKDLDTALVVDNEGIKNERLYVARGVIYVIQDRTDDALANFNQALQFNPFNTDALLNRGNIWRQRQKLDLALNDYYAALRINHQLPMAYYGLALVYEELGQNDNALILLKEAVLLNPLDQKIKTYFEELSKKLN